MKIALPRNRMLLLLPLLAAAVCLAIFGDKTPNGGAKAAVTPVKPPSIQATAAREVQSNKGKSPVQLEGIERLVPRSQLTSAAAEASADLFVSPDWSAKPHPTPAPVTAQLAPEPVPVAVPNYRVLGKKLENEVWELYLGQDDASFIVRAGDTLEGIWRIEKIDPPTVSMTHVPTGNTQSLAIGDAR
jgi:hypothetical protein